MCRNSTQVCRWVMAGDIGPEATPHIVAFPLRANCSLQQAEALRTHTDLRVGVLCGEMAVDWWEAGRWAKELAQHDLLVSTLQVLVDALRYGFLKVGGFSPTGIPLYFMH